MNLRGMKMASSRYWVLGLLLLLPVISDAIVNNASDAAVVAQWPFPVVQHPLQLSSALFAGDEPAVEIGDDLPRRTTVPIDAEPSAPTLLGDVPFPTGAWWTNLVLEQGDITVVTMPYCFRVLQGKLHVSYPFRVVLPSVIQSGFVSQIVVSSVPVTEQDANVPLEHRVAGFDAFGVTVKFARHQEDDKHDAFLVHLVRGSPYVTIEYRRAIPLLESMDGLRITGLKRYDTATYSDGQPVDFAMFGIMLTNGQIWHVFASDPSLELQLVDGRVRGTAAYSGILRVALALTADAVPHLIDSAPVYPVGGSVHYEVNATKNEATLLFRWKTRRFLPTSASDDSGETMDDSKRDTRSRNVLMLALPHHVDMMETQSDRFLSNVIYTSIRGRMTGIVGGEWNMTESLPEVEFDYPDEGLFDPSISSNAEHAAMASKAKDEIVRSLKDDVKQFPNLPPDSYYFGKLIAREARLLLTANRFNETEVRDSILTKMKIEMQTWLTASNENHLVYDEKFGGVVTSNGVRDKQADYGNGYYNDHHFHYGYFIYALSVIRKFAPEYIAKHAAACAMLVADIGTPPEHSATFANNFPAHHYFPVARHKDWYVGHSYASGLFPMEVGKSQESSSEAVNAYYALALFGSLDKDARTVSHTYFQFARLLLATEIRSTRKYWHMRANSRVYEPIFSKNAMIGVVGEMSVVYSTWFGDNVEYVHGINMIPFTPATRYLMNDAYVVREFPLLQDSLRRMPASNIWKSAIVLDHAILDAAAAWTELTTVVDAFDTWNSRSNSLYWIASRPSWYDQKSRAKLLIPNVHDDDKCFGFPACSTAGDQGTALQCCSFLPGCCPSSLSCCPKRDPSTLPLNACFGEHECAVLGLGCCNTIMGCCEPDPISGVVLGCCRHAASVHRNASTPVSVPPSASGCAKDPKCAALGLDCCSAPGGCCQPDPVSGAKLNCCEGSKPSAAVPSASEQKSCHDQPRCAAAQLDCCSTGEGCCSNTSGPQLDCCDVPKAPSPVSAQTTDVCFGEAECAKANLDCCSSPLGCCEPDQVTGLKLLCCSGQHSKLPSDVFGTCHGRPACARAGSNHTALNCCATEKGCCPGLLCCDDGDTATTKTTPTATTGRSMLTFALLLVAGVCMVVAVIVFATMCYRRRHYTQLEQPDMRSWYCALVMVIVVAFFIFLVANA